MDRTLMIKTTEIFDSIHDGVMLFEVDNENLENQLIYLNQAARQVLKSPKTDEICIYSLEQMLNISYEELGDLLRRLEINNSIVEEHVIQNCDNVSDLVTCRLGLFKETGKSFVQIVINRKNLIKTMGELTSVESYLKELEFSKGFLAILCVKNIREMIDLYGQDKHKLLNEIVFEELVEDLGKSGSISILKDDYFIISFFADKDLFEEGIKTFLDKINSKLMDKGFNFICNFKIGISSFSKSKYNALHEAKFCLQMILNSDDDYLFYIQPHDKQYLDFLIKSDLPYAIENNEFDVFFQGIYHTKTNRLFGFESLIRWKHSKYGNIPPATFIPIAERSDLITKIDLWVLKNALTKFKKEIYSVDPSLKININISPKDFFVDGFTDKFLATVKKSGIPYKNVILELTETLNLYPKKSYIENLKAKGILIALDDFGTGFASLSQLKNYQIDILKIDISFVKDINKNYNNTLITSAILSMAKDLDIHVIAEGVETLEQVEFLQRRDCSFVQGFKFHKPESINGFSQLLVDKKSIYLEMKKNELNREDYVKEYSYGKYIYLQLSSDGSVEVFSDRLREITDYDLVEDMKFVNIIKEEMQDLFRSKLKEVLTTEKHSIFISYTMKDKVEVPIAILLSYNQYNQSVDVYLENYMNRREEFIRVKNVYNRYDLIFDVVRSAIILTDMNMRIEEWNNAASEIFGYSRQEALGKNAIKLLVDEELHEKVNIIATNSLMGQDTYSVNENITKSQKKITCEWQGTRLTDEKGQPIGVVSIVKDVTKEKQVEAQLDLLSTLVNQDPSPIVITNLKGNIEYVNHAFTELTLYTEDELLGNNPRLLSSHEQTESYYRNLWETISKGHMWKGQFRNLKKDGTTYITDSRIFPIKNKEDKVIKYACIQNDISKSVARESYVKEINETLENQERLSMIGQMAAGIIHEINNPLSFIDINVHALHEMLDEIEDGRIDHETELELKELTEDLKEGITSIKKIAAGLKRFTYRSQANEFDFLSLNDEIDTIITISKNEYKYYAEVHFEKGDIDDLYGDSGKIKQVLLNLIINAVHAIREANKEGFGQINISTFQKEGYIYCTIEDNGSGIAQAVADKIFEPFFTTKKNGKGTGLGLSLSKKIIEEEHKGKLYFETKLGEGTTFIVRFDAFKKNEDDKDE